MTAGSVFLGPEVGAVDIGVPFHEREGALGHLAPDEVSVGAQEARGTWDSASARHVDHGLVVGEDRSGLALRESNRREEVLVPQDELNGGDCRTQCEFE